MAAKSTQLADLLLNEKERPRVVAEVSHLIETQVSAKRGFSGAALRTALTMARKASPSAIPNSVDHLLPEFCATLQPHFDAFQAQGTGTFTDYVKQRKVQISDEILAVTDRRATRSNNKTLKSMYAKLRSTAEDEVRNIAPGLARVVDERR
ncbi:hypothetical protein GYB61_03755 [bacterium]|nr:hypothetical protein [bacterium]